MPCTMHTSMPSLLSAISLRRKHVLQLPLSSLMMTMPAVGKGDAHIGQPIRAQIVPGVPAMRAHRALDAPERVRAPSPPSSPTSPPQPSSSPHLYLAPRHAQLLVDALSPSSPSKVRRQYRRRYGIIPSRLVSLSLRQLARKHRHDAGKPPPSLLCPFATQRRRTMDDLHGYPQLPRAAINRRLPLLISSHHPALLPSLLLLDHLAHHLVAGAAPI